MKNKLTNTLLSASHAITAWERFALIGLAAGVTLLILLNVFTRAANYAIYWVDELAILTMIWLVMIGASATIRSRSGIAVTLLEPVLGARLWCLMRRIVDLIILLFSLILVWLSWIWYDPLTLAVLGFDTAAFSSATFNFIYDEPTLTIGVPKFLIWLVMPISAITMSIHAAANLLTGPPAATGE